MTTIDRTEFKTRRDHGLKARHAQRLARLQPTTTITITPHTGGFIVAVTTPRTTGSEWVPTYKQAQYMAATVQEQLEEAGESVEVLG